MSKQMYVFTAVIEWSASTSECVCVASSLGVATKMATDYAEDVRMASSVGKVVSVARGAEVDAVEGLDND